MQYPIFIHKDENSDYGVIVPDLPGCFSAGSTVEEAMLNAHEAIECHLEALLMDKQTIPVKQPIEEHLNNPDFKGGVLAVVDIDFSKISGKTIRIDVNLPECFLKQIDEYANRYGGNRSEFLVDVVMNYMTRHSVKSINR